MGWKLITLKQYPVFSRQWIIEAFRDDMQELIGYGFKQYKSLDTGIYADEEEYCALQELMVKRLKQNREDIKKPIRNWVASSTELIAYAKECSTLTLKDMPNEKLLGILHAAVVLFKKTAAYLFMTEVLDGYYGHWLEGILIARVPSEDHRRTYHQVLTSCTRTTGLHTAHQQLLTILRSAGTLTLDEIQNDPALHKELAAYTAEFRWLGYDTGIGRDFTIEDTLKKIAGLLGKGSIEHVENNGTTRSEIIEELRLTDEEKDHLGIMDDLIYARAYRGEAQSIAGMYLRPLLTEIAKRCNSDYDSIIYLTFAEIEQGVADGNLDRNLVAKRKQAFGLLMADGKIHIYAGTAVSQLDDAGTISNIHEVRGTVANRGTVRGPARIVIKSNEFGKVMQGDILVTKMTTPEFIVVLEKCVGIVTDIGGITCHASIVSRELGIPAVIGTKIATQIFQDGDLLELDAVHGVVKKIGN